MHVHSAALAPSHGYLAAFVGTAGPVTGITKLAYWQFWDVRLADTASDVQPGHELSSRPSVLCTWRNRQTHTVPLTVNKFKDCRENGRFVNKAREAPVRSLIKPTPSNIPFSVPVSSLWENIFQVISHFQSQGLKRFRHLLSLLYMLYFPSISLSLSWYTQ